MKKYLTLSLCALVLSACKIEIEKDISLKAILNDPIKTETALLNVEISSCNNHDDSRQPSESLINIKQQIPTVFPNATFKECYKKKFDSFASFELPIGVGVYDGSSKLENDINILSYGELKLWASTSKKLAANIRKFLKKEHISNLELDVLLKVKNDTGESQKFTVSSAYLDGAPVSLGEFNFEKEKTILFKLANSSADRLYMYQDGGETIILSSSEK
ncbi:DUF7424 family protein [Testudinibacter sp. P27/CKL/0425]